MLTLNPGNQNTTNILKKFEPKKNEGKLLIDGITRIKIPLLNFLYFIFLESEKISEDFIKCNAGL
jgi:hypothetical protein